MAIATGSYTGNGSGDRTIPLVFTPKFVLVMSEAAVSMHFSNFNTGVRRFKFLNAAAPTGYGGIGQGSYGPTLTTNGFIVSDSATGSPNVNVRVYHYYAIG